MSKFSPLGKFRFGDNGKVIKIVKNCYYSSADVLARNDACMTNINIAH